MSHSGNYKDITGQKFNRLTALRYVGMNKDKHALWECVCDCGNVVVVQGSNLRSGNTKSCGCYNIDRIKERNHILKWKHGGRDTKLFHIWSGMKTRCYNPNAINYKDYGAKGITICDEWLKDFANFKEWALNNGYSPELTIDRIDYNGNYEPNNCRWCTTKEQNRNRSSNTLITYKGETHCIADWADIIGMKYSILQRRLNNPHYTLERAFTEPPRKRKT